MVTSKPNLPLVSVVMPAKNSKKTISESIESILDQTLKELELIVVDDGSDDGTTQLVENYQKKEPRISFFLNAGNGICDARNTGLSHANASLYAVMDSDDISAPTRLERQFMKFEKSEELILLGSYFNTFKETSILNPKTIPTENEEIKNAILIEPTYAHPTIMARTQSVRKVGGYRKFFEGSEDHDLYLRLSHLGKMATIPEFLLNYRLHPSQISQQQKAMGFRASVAAVYCDLCVRENRIDPSISGETCENIVIQLLERITSNDGCVSKSEQKLGIRAIRGLSILPEFQNHCVEFRKKLVTNLIKTGQIQSALKFLRSTRRSRWLTS